ncbi:hypothetical protein PoB_005812000 [Plakobranchus ocellatus]|uniref:Uncharacterized protein n=1 Tax=Plakobranchus ocellatus TaxID=259542 RepID=A0AAV4CFL3_9GAST|nr:hypothetical protein PoB_005812000 [Plakobranchus ocellatus]
MSDRPTQRKEDYLDWLYENFSESAKSYTSAVKAALRSQTRENAAEIFERAIDVLSQEFPDPTSIDGQTTEDADGNRNKLNSLKSRISQMEKQLEEEQNKSWTFEWELESVRGEAQDRCSFMESQLNSSLKKNVRHLDTKISGLEKAVEALASEIKDSIQEESVAEVIPPLTALSALALSRPVENVRQRTNFSAAVTITADQHPPSIRDVKLLSGRRLLLADSGNDCCMLFDTQGHHLHTLECRSYPWRLAVLESSGTSHYIIAAVTLPDCPGIDILVVAGDNIKVKRIIETSKQYEAVAAVNNQTLAIGYWTGQGIDLIDLQGRVLRQICSSVHPWHMEITEGGDLVCSTLYNAIARVQVDTGAIAFNTSGVVILTDCLVLVNNLNGTGSADVGETLQLVDELQRMEKDRFMGN